MVSVIVHGPCFFVMWAPAWLGVEKIILYNAGPAKPARARHKHARTFWVSPNYLNKRGTRID